MAKSKAKIKKVKLKVPSVGSNKKSRRIKGTYAQKSKTRKMTEEIIKKQIGSKYGELKTIDQHRFDAFKLQRKVQRKVYTARYEMRKIGINEKLLEQYFPIDMAKTKNPFDLKSSRQVKSYINSLKKQDKELGRIFKKEKRMLRRVSKFTARVEFDMRKRADMANSIINNFIDNVDAEMGLAINPGGTRRPQVEISKMHGTFPLPYLDKFTDREAFEEEVDKWKKEGWNYHLKEDRFRDSLKTARDGLLNRPLTESERGKIESIYDKVLGLTDSQLTAFTRLNVYNAVQILTSSSTDEVLNNFEKIMSVINRIEDATEV